MAYYLSGQLLMSLELVDECVKRLSQSLSQIERLLALYDSKELEGLIYQMAKCEGNYVQVHDSTKKVLDQYGSSLQRLAQINSKLEAKPAAELPPKPELSPQKKASQESEPPKPS